MSLEQEILGQFQTPEFEPIKVFGRDLLVKAFSGEDFGWCQKVSLEEVDGVDEDGKKQIQRQTDLRVFKAAVAVISLHAQDHSRVFPFSSLSELKAKIRLVALLPERELFKIYKVAAPLSSLEEGSLGDAEKNSETTPTKSGGTESPES